MLIPFKMGLVEASEQEITNEEPEPQCLASQVSNAPELGQSPQNWSVPVGEPQHTNCDPELGQVGVAPNCCPEKLASAAC